MFASTLQGPRDRKIYDSSSPKSPQTSYDFTKSRGKEIEGLLK